MSISNEQIFDTIFELAVRQAAQETWAELNAPLEEEHVFSEAHTQRMKGIFRRHSRRIRWHDARLVAKRVAVVALVIMSVLFGSLMTVEAVREEVIRVVTEWFEQFTNVRFVNESEDSGNEDIDLNKTGIMLPSYIPRGYELVEADRTFASLMVIYEGANGDVLIYDQYVHENDDSISIDNERHTLEQVLINGYASILAMPDEAETQSVILIWQDDIYTYFISGTLDRATIIAIAESLENADENIF